jgi:hypothetical protein
MRRPQFSALQYYTTVVFTAFLSSPLSSPHRGSTLPRAVAVTNAKRDEGLRGGFGNPGPGSLKDIGFQISKLT